MASELRTSRGSTQNGTGLPTLVNEGQKPAGTEAPTQISRPRVHWRRNYTQPAVEPSSTSKANKPAPSIPKANNPAPSTSSTKPQSHLRHTPTSEPQRGFERKRFEEADTRRFGVSKRDNPDKLKDTEPKAQKGTARSSPSQEDVMTKHLEKKAFDEMIEALILEQDDEMGEQGFEGRRYEVRMKEFRDEKARQELGFGVHWDARNGRLRSLKAGK